MKFILFYLLIVWLPIGYPSALAQESRLVLTASTISAGFTSWAEISYFKGAIKKDRVVLNWAIDNNEQVNRFEVERSGNGKNFVMAGLVFGTDQPGKVEYPFYEKRKKAKSFYRLKMIHNDGAIVYSPIISPGEPATAKR